MTASVCVLCDVLMLFLLLRCQIIVFSTHIARNLIYILAFLASNAAHMCVRLWSLHKDRANENRNHRIQHRTRSPWCALVQTCGYARHRSTGAYTYNRRRRHFHFAKTKSESALCAAHNNERISMGADNTNANLIYFFADLCCCFSCG